MSFINVRKPFLATAAVIIFLLVISLSGGNRVFAQEPDTSGVVFTDITTATDSLIAAKKDSPQAVKAASKTISAAPAEKSPRTLWSIFIAGFLGGFAAFLMPCIYPMLPLT